MQAIVAVASVLLTLLPNASIAGLPDHRADGYAPRVVGWVAVPYSDWPTLPRRDTGVVDETGVRMHRSSDGVLHNQPVSQAQYGIRLLASWHATNDPWFLDRALRQAQRLVDTRVEARGGWFYPYDYDFTIADDASGTLRPPWYSDMAQGLALTLFSRVYSVTGDASWRTAADATFVSMTLPPSDSDPWATYVDANGYLWLEEYPRNPPASSENVLNGLMFAIYGVWDYWRITRSADAAALFDAAATTVSRYTNSYRNSRWASSYSLRGDRPHTRYHLTHINQLLRLHALSGNPRFATLAESLQADYAAPTARGFVDFAKQTVIAYKFNATGAIIGRRSLVISKPTSAPADQRSRILNRVGYWYRLTSGPLAGYWVGEAPGLRMMRGPVARLDYLAYRSVTLPAGALTLVTAAGAKSTVTLPSAVTLRVRASAWIQGRRVVLLREGPYAGLWTPLTASTTLG